MKMVEKFVLEIEPRQTIKIPFNASILQLTVIHDKPVIWALIDPNMRKIDRTFLIFAPGKEIPDRLNEDNWVGSFEQKMEVGSIELHIFEEL